MAKHSSKDEYRNQKWREKQKKQQDQRRSDGYSISAKDLTPPPAPKPSRPTITVKVDGSSIGSIMGGIFEMEYKSPFMSIQETAAQKEERRKAREKKGYDILDRLTSLPGMSHVKTQVEEMIALKDVAVKRKAAGLKTEAHSLHMVFEGNPGTGKTTAARMIGEAFIHLGLLKSEHETPPFIQIVQSDVISAYVGRAEQNIREKFQEAKGGVLFIDEAYALNGPYEWNKNMLAAIVSCVEDMRDEVLVIIAGYAKEMEEFLEGNPGLRSRFPTVVDFPDYTLEQLIDIAELMATERDYTFATSAVAGLMQRLDGEKKQPNFGNARVVRNVIEESIRRHSKRMKSVEDPSKEDLMTLKGADINKEFKVRKAEDTQQAGKNKKQSIQIMIPQQLIREHDIDPWGSSKH